MIERITKKLNEFYIWVCEKVYGKIKDEPKEEGSSESGVELQTTLEDKKNGLE